MPRFEPGEILDTRYYGLQAKIISLLGSGGRSEVYEVDIMGHKKALIWYTDTYSKIFYNNLRDKVLDLPLDENILWPEEIIEKIDANGNISFGYITNLIQDRYIDFGEFLRLKNKSYMITIKSCINIVLAMQKLHRNGYCFQIFDEGSFFIDIENGDVLISDIENVVPVGTNTGVIGVPRYMAPEIITGDGKVLPDANSDRFLLTVILFTLMFNSHPLEGKKSLLPCISYEIAREIYGYNPLFVYDESDDSNRPNEIIHKNLQQLWSAMPEYIKDTYKSALSKEALHNPKHRIMENDWLRVLTRLKNDILVCPCGNEVVLKQALTTECECCGTPISINRTIKLPFYTIFATSGTMVYRCQLGICNADEALTPVALVVAKPDDPTVLGVKNMTSNILKAITPSGKEKQVQPQEVVPFKSGIIIEAYDSKIEFN